MAICDAPSPEQLIKMKQREINNLKSENERLRTFVKYVASIDCAVVSDPDHENPLSMGELQAEAKQALKS